MKVYNAPVLGGKSTDIACIEMILNQFMEGQNINMMSVIKDRETGEIVLYGSDNGFRLVDIEYEED